MTLWSFARVMQLAEHWGLAGRISPLAGERDANFRMDEADGSRWVLKVSHPDEDPAVGAFQAEAQLHVRVTDPDLPVPELRLTRRGRPWLRVDADHTPDGHMRLVRVVRWMQGVPAATTPGQGPRFRADLGQAMARLDMALADFTHPAQNHPLVWDLSRAHEVLDRLDHVTDPDLRILTGKTLQTHADDWGPRAALLRRQLIHNDMNPHNLLVPDSGADRLVGIIDFGDMVEAPLVNELGVALSYLPTDGDDPLLAMAEVLASYHAVNPLDDAEFAVLPGLIRTRMAATIANSHWLAAIRPENRDYLLRNMPRAADGLARLAALSEFEAAARLRTACMMLEDQP